MIGHVRKLAAIAALIALGGFAVSYSSASDTVPPEVKEKFEFLSQNGNSSCSRAFMDSIATMPELARLQGSCCSEMDLGRYSEQIEGLKKYRDLPIIPPDPYDLEVRLARTLLAAYDMPLNADQQQAYDFAMANSDEKGPCCCQCWRWHVIGGLGKLLIREYEFTGRQVTEVWDLVDGCGGAEDHG